MKKQHDTPRHNTTFHAQPFEDGAAPPLSAKASEIIMAARQRRGAGSKGNGCGQ